jgi:uncharacterized protein YdhG (YjbR/CyaY superfamily)
MPKTDYKTIDQYHAAFSGEVVARMQKIREIIHKAVPDVEEVISYQIPCFMYNGYLIYYSAYTKHVSLATPWSEVFLKHFAKDLKSYKVSKSSIQIPNDKDLPIDLIKRIVEFRKKENDDAVMKVKKTKSK